ncbi:MAG: Lrp/AsnC family transcriptional regulator [Phycisphaerales bacterium]|nr:Lrp/AsnC family transcriptional regulator [Phycisphaerales bacterium]
MPTSRRTTAVKLDDIDLKILRILQSEARITNTALAKRIGISPPSTLERVKKLEARSVIDHYAAILNPPTVGKGTVALVSVTLKEHGLGPLETLKREMSAFDEVLACWHTAGDEDFILKVAVKDMNEYEGFVTHRLSSLPHIGRIRTTFILSTVKETTEFPL